jgi:hypothetical protein
MYRVILCMLAGCAALATGLAADSSVPTDLATRLRGASRTVVGSVSRAESRMVRTPRGDRMIVTRTWIRVEESLKGRHDAYIEVDIEGGTLGQLSMRVSDMEPLAVGERAVVLLEPTAEGGWRPHRRGLGLLRLGGNNRVVGSDVTLDQLRRMAAEVK